MSPNGLVDWIFGAPVRRLEQGQDFEAQQSAPEGKGLDEQHVGACLGKDREQLIAAALAPGVVNRLIVLIEQLLEADIGSARRRQLHEARASDVEIG